MDHLKEDKPLVSFSASSSQRWMNCQASGVLVSKAPKPESNIYASDGIRAHKHLQLALDNYLITGRVGFDAELRENKKIFNAVKYAHDFFISRIKKDSEVFVEKKFNLGNSLNITNAKMRGIADFCVYNPKEMTLEVWDYKHGAGIEVDIMDSDLNLPNTQLLYYALGAYHSIREAELKMRIPIKTLYLGVVQPRLKNEDSWIKPLYIVDPDFKYYEDRFLEAIKKSFDPDAKTTPGSWCKYCPSKDFNCPSYESIREDKIKEMFSDELSLWL